MTWTAFTRTLLAGTRCRARRALAPLACVVALTACPGRDPGRVADSSSNGDRGASLESTPMGSPGVIIAAGDIADCTSHGDEATAELLDSIRGTVVVLGDNAYPSGTDANFAQCYDPTWGRHKARTRPTPGNHEYRTAGAGGYFRYYGAAAGDPEKGYYSYDLGDWHIIVLNTNSNCADIRCGTGSAQLRWLREDLAAHPAQCTLAYWHHPRWNSGSHHGNNDRVGPFWDALYERGADVVLNGHEHLYERFAPQTPNAQPDPARGIRQFTVGTGGRREYSFGDVQPNSEVRQTGTDGVLKLELDDDGYRWEFIPVRGGTFRDSGSGKCH
jgi:hypothetical protein